MFWLLRLLHNRDVSLVMGGHWGHLRWLGHGYWGQSGVGHSTLSGNTCTNITNETWRISQECQAKVEMSRGWDFCSPRVCFIHGIQLWAFKKFRLFELMSIKSDSQLKTDETERKLSKALFFKAWHPDPGLLSLLRTWTDGKYMTPGHWIHDYHISLYR